MNKEYDIIYCGSGPINLLQAIAAKKRGLEVVIIERDHEIGGAWKSHLHESEYFEIGCHIMDRHAKVLDFITHKMGVEMKPLSPGPTVFSRGKHIPYDYKNKVFFIQKKLQNLKTFKFQKLFWDKENLAPFKLFPRAYYYPSGGSYFFMKPIYDQLKSLQLNCFKDCNIKSLVINEDKSEVILSNGDTIEAKKVVVSPFTHLEQVQHLKQRIEIDYSSRLFRHILIESSAELNKPFSYVRIMSDQVIHRISTQSTNGDKYFYLIGINDNKHTQYEADELMPHIQSSLRNMKLLHDQNLTIIKDMRYPTQYISGIQADQLRKIEGLQVNYSTNLIYSMHYHWDQIKEAF